MCVAHVFGVVYYTPHTRGIVDECGVSLVFGGQIEYAFRARARAVASVLHSNWIAAYIARQMHGENINAHKH